MADEININEHSKDQHLAPDIEDSQNQYLTTDQGVRISHTDDTLKVGERGPTLVQDFHFREKITHFDHERIPERVVHARGAGAHGYFQVYESMARYTKASSLQDPFRENPGVRPLLNSSRISWLSRHSSRRTRLCHKILY